MRTDRTTELLRKGYPSLSRLRNAAVAVPARQLGRRVAVLEAREEVR
jgi:hypothetical protein